jgi:alkylation response protein AidB-like acyl-CoA dehydrogenase
MLYGTKLPVADGDVADLAVVVARSSEASPAVSFYLVELAGDGVTREPVATIDPTRSHARLTFEGAPAQPLGTTGEGWSLVGRLADRAAVLLAFEQLGGADAALEMATEYAKSRYAFGRPIGSFQAIKHKLADAFIANELARSNCYYAAWALSSDAADLPIAAAAARVGATQAFEYIAAENIQTHGGIGFTWESDCQLFYRRAKLLALSLGGVYRWKNRLIDQLENRVAAEPEAVGAKR